MTADLFALNAGTKICSSTRRIPQKKFTDEPVTDEQVAAIYDLIEVGSDDDELPSQCASC